MIRVGRWVLAAVLPADVREAMLAELDAEYRDAIRGSRNAVAARLWYCGRSPDRSGRRWRCGAGVAAKGASRWARSPRDGSRTPHTTHGSVPGCSPGTDRSPSRLSRPSALGIGGTAAMFGVIDGVLLRPLPYQDPDRLVRIWSANPRGIPRNGISPPDFFDWRTRARAFTSIAAFAPTEATLTGAGDPVRIAGADATADLAATLGVQPLRGRWFTTADMSDAGMVVIGETLWRERFGGADEIVGRTILLDGAPRLVDRCHAADVSVPLARRASLAARPRRLGIAVPRGTFSRGRRAAGAGRDRAKPRATSCARLRARWKPHTRRAIAAGVSRSSP